ncbi:OprO/OprP family phosphate-selective porin [Methylotenera sp.]|uniref:OprO/OprP family phosphate-selective porin n=1 Tax=Methylotenera sp. TaxID=2051956 RepID=UPI00271985D4|nr:porin [Methylotenera sp.]MDO9204803.1 porin [Methylotenera sp.]MDO9393184.1 porin [Methylotenera sp.]MDP1521622.1 porin [Methylotenera sp.]MDP2070275.1 porin [Methylotenera sp.]MDP2230542.1 porin [Methylotenera sp.]
MQFKFTKFATVLLASGIISLPITASANDSKELEELRGLVQELSQQVKILARKGEIGEEDAAKAKKETPVVKASSSGFSFGSADGKNEIKFRGLVQADHRHYFDGANDVRNRSNQRAGDLDANGFHDAEDTSLLRRVRPTIEGKVGKYGFRFTPEFAGGSASAVDAYIEANLNPAFKIRAGKQKSIVGLERLQGGGDIKFIERSYVTNAILPNRDLGVTISGDVLGNKLNYGVGIVNGVNDGGNISTGTEYNGEREYTARLFATPFNDSTSALAGLGFGIGATYTDFTGEKNLNFTDTSSADATRNGLPSYVSDGQQTFFRYSSAAVADGKRFRVSPQANFYNGPFGVIAEYARVSQDVSLTTGGSPAAGGAGTNTAFTAGSNKKLNHDAWQIATSYLITGEDASFKGVKPKSDFDLDKGGWGAWELVARYSEINLDDDTFKNPAGSLFTGAYADLSTSAKSAKSWVAGVNWYLNSNAKIALNYSHTNFDGGAGVGTTAVNGSGSNIRDRESENALLARFQVAF